MACRFPEQVATGEELQFGKNLEETPASQVFFVGKGAGGSWEVGFCDTNSREKSLFLGKWEVLLGVEESFV